MAYPRRQASSIFYGQKGDSYDIALAHTIKGLHRAEVIHRQSWPTREAADLATLQLVAAFNHHRLLASIGYISPAEAEASYSGNSPVRPPRW